MENTRLQMLNSQFKAQPTNTFNAKQVLPKSDDDIVICAHARTAMTRAKKGPQKDTPPEIMLSVVMKDVLRKANNLDPKYIEDICIGNVIQPGAGFGTSRMAQFLAGFPDTTPFYSVNRLCSSGMQSVMNIASSISRGEIDMGLAGGVESMSLGSMD